MDDETEKEDNASVSIQKNDDGEDYVFMKDYREKRMRELVAASGKAKSTATSSLLSPREFGTVIESDGFGWYTKEVSEESSDVTVVVHIYEPHIRICNKLNAHLDDIAKKWRSTKFVRLKSSLSGVHVNPSMLPALSIYRAGQQLSVIKNFRDEISDEGSGDSFTREDVEWLFEQSDGWQ